MNLDKSKASNVLFISSLIFGALTCSAFSQGISSLVGTWNHDSTGENIEIKRSGDVSDSNLGQGRISSTVEYAANYVIVYQGNRKCWFYITKTSNNERINLAVRNNRQSEDTCLRGPFNRAD